MVKRKDSIRNILNVIYRYGPVSRAAIADKLKLTIPAVTVNITSLVESGLIGSSPAPLEEPALGRPKQLLDFVPSAWFTAGIDVGPYATYCCVSDIRGRVAVSEEYPICPGDYSEAVEFIAETLDAVIAKSGISPSSLAGVGIGTPGFVDTDKGLLRHSTMHSWGNVMLARDVEALTGYPVVMENNARCRSLAVSMLEDRTLPDTYAYLYVAKGIACPVRIGNKDFPGTMSAAGEIGHMIMDKDGPVCPTCSHRGCLEALSSERAVTRAVQGLVKEGKTDFPFQEDIGINDVLMAAGNGDEEIWKILDKAMLYLGLALANTINLLNPGLVLVDGYMMRMERNRAVMLKVARDNLFALDITDVDIRFVDFDKLRTARGAAAKAIERFVLEEEKG